MGLQRQDWRPRLARELPFLDGVQVPGLREFARAAQADYERWEGGNSEFVRLFNDPHDQNMLLDGEC